VLKACRLHPAGVRGSEHDELDRWRVASDVGLEPAVDQQLNAVNRGVERGLGRRVEPTVRGLTCRKDVDPFGAELDRARYRTVVDNPAVNQPQVTDPHWRKHAGNRCGGDHRLKRRPS